MFYIDDNDYSITLSKGDTGAVTFTCTGYNFGENDRALFTIRNSRGSEIKKTAYALTDNAFTVTFRNSDTDTLAAGAYSYDVRYVIHPYYDANGAIVDGDQVITPRQPMRITILDTVGEI